MEKYYIEQIRAVIADCEYIQNSHESDYTKEILRRKNKNDKD